MSDGDALLVDASGMAVGVVLPTAEDVLARTGVALGPALLCAEEMLATDVCAFVLAEPPAAVTLAAVGVLVPISNDDVVARALVLAVDLPIDCPVDCAGFTRTTLAASLVAKPKDPIGAVSLLT